VKTPSVGLLEACDDEKLLAFELTPAQREIAHGLARGPRTHVLCCGRRGGKSSLASLLGIWHAALRPDLAEFVRRGEPRYSLVVAVSLEQARVLIRLARSVVESSSIVSRLVEGQTDDEIRFRGGGVLRALPCTSRSTRGLAASVVVFDEADHHVPDEYDGPASARALFQALVPSVSQFGSEGRLLYASTPAGGEGTPFSDLFQRASSGELPDARSYHFTSKEMNPRAVDDALLAEEEARDPQGYAIEYLAQFGTGASGFFAAEDIAACVGEWHELARTDALEGSWQAALDPSFGRDPTALIVIGRHPVEKGLLVVGAARTWRAGGRPAESLEERFGTAVGILDEVAEVCRGFGVQRIITDQFMAAGVADRLRRHGLSVAVRALTQTGKRDAFVELRSRLASRTIMLLDSPELLRDLRMVRSRYSAGVSPIVTPRSAESHADLAIALAMATYELRHVRGDGLALPRSGRIEGPLDRIGAALPTDSTRHSRWLDGPDDGGFPTF
jgi:hypothetical protein